jgi:uncharacterized protein (TIGR02453 family)
MASYFSDELFEFLKRLKRNNKRDWLQRHKDEYERCVKQPALRFITDFGGPLLEITPHLLSSPKSSLFRIYRDTRFSHDKRPYKTNLAMRFSHIGRDVHSPGFYLHMEPGASFAAAGLWHPEPPVLLKVRTAIVARPQEWKKVRGLLNWDDANKLSRPPRGFPCDHEFIDDLKLRDIGTAVDLSDKQVCSPKFMELFAGACRTMSPLARFLSSALGLKF